MENIILEKILVQGNHVEYKFSYTEGLKKYFTTDKMVLEYDTAVESVPVSILTIPFVGSLIAFSWLENCVFWVKEIDETYYRCLSRLKNAYQELYPDYPLKGRFVPAKIVKNELGAMEKTNSLLLFSGGADAHTSYIRHMDTNPLLCNIQGWYKSITDEDKAADADVADIRKFAATRNLSTAFVKSNFATVLDVKKYTGIVAKKTGDSWWHGFQHSMAFISIAIPVAFQNNISRIIIASSCTIGDFNSCASYSTTDSEFRYADEGYVVHDGFELCRQDKIKILVDHQQKSKMAYPIRVCSFNDHNCCVCEKCFRTITGIVAEGGDIKSFDFNIDKPLKEFYSEYFDENIALWGVCFESIIYWPNTKKRMLENYSNIKEKDFVDWFLSYDFKTQKRRGMLTYYRKNFFAIIKRKFPEWLK